MIVFSVCLYDDFDILLMWWKIWYSRNSRTLHMQFSFAVILLYTVLSCIYNGFFFTTVVNVCDVYHAINFVCFKPNTFGEFVTFSSVCLTGLLNYAWKIKNNKSIRWHILHHISKIHENKIKITINTKIQNIIKIISSIEIMVNVINVTIWKTKNLKYKEHFHNCHNHKRIKITENTIILRQNQMITILGYNDN